MQGMEQFTSLVTGANTGLGKATAKALAARGDRVIFACRTEARAREAIDEVAAATGSDQLEFLELDLADLDQVRTAAASLVERGDPIHVLVANAGIAAQKGVTAQGFELAFGVNHLGHFLFVTELLPLLEAGSPAPDGAPARLVVVSSGSHYDAKKGIDFDAVQQPTFFTKMIEAVQSPSATGLTWCNDTPHKVMAAVATDDGKTVTSRGWYRIDPGKCLHPDVTGQPRQVFSFAEAVDNDNRTVKYKDKALNWGGATQLCTRESKFEINEQGDCATRGLSAAGFVAVEMSGGGKTLRFAMP